MDLIALFTAAPAAPYAWSLVLAGAVVIATSSIRSHFGSR